MTVFPIPAFMDNYIWGIIDEKTHNLDCVDPGEAAPVLDFLHLKTLKLRSILLTHHHHDHVGGVSELITLNPSCIIYGPKDIRIEGITQTLQQNQTIKIGLNTFKILFTPGHTSTHICYFEPHKKWLFCGDTLFSAGCGRIFDGTMGELFHSLQAIKTLPLETKVFCAHEYTRQNLKFAQYVEPQNPYIIQYLNFLNKKESFCSLPSTLEHELLINPFLRTDNMEVKDFALRNGASSKEEFEIFHTLRSQKDQFKA